MVFKEGGIIQEASDALQIAAELDEGVSELPQSTILPYNDVLHDSSGPVNESFMNYLNEGGKCIIFFTIQHYSDKFMLHKSI